MSGNKSLKSLIRDSAVATAVSAPIYSGLSALADHSAFMEKFVNVKTLEYSLGFGVTYFAVTSILYGVDKLLSRRSR